MLLQHQSEIKRGPPTPRWGPLGPRLRQLLLLLLLLLHASLKNQGPLPRHSMQERGPQLEVSCCRVSLSVLPYLLQQSCLLLLLSCCSSWARPLLQQQQQQQLQQQQQKRS